MTEEVVPYGADLPPLGAVTIPNPGDGDALLARAFLARAIRSDVTDASTYEAGAHLLMQLKATRKATDDKRLLLKKPLDALVKIVQDMYNPILAAYDQGEIQLKEKLNTYDQEQRRIAADAQRRAQAEADRVRRETEERAAAARRKAEADAAEIRRKADAQAEEERRKARAVADEQRRQAEAAAAAGRAEEARKLREKAAEDQAAADARAAEMQLKAAAKADEKIDRAEQRASDLETQAVATVAPIVQSATPKVSGVSRRTNWVYRVKDASQVKPMFMMMDETKIASTVRSLHKDAETVVGGIEVFEEAALGARKGASSA